MSEESAPAPIDYHVLKLIVGLVALGIAIATSALTPLPLESISASYHAGGSARDVLVGSLVAVGAIMLAHNGADRREMKLSKVAAVAAFGVALFPCDCGADPELAPSVHYLAAAVMFIVLAAFCWVFYLRARAKRSTHARVRAVLYAGCGVAIILVVATLGADFLSGGMLRARVTQLVFYGEWVGLSSFGASWLLASRTLPFVTAAAPDDRVALW